MNSFRTRSIAVALAAALLLPTVSRAAGVDVQLVGLDLKRAAKNLRGLGDGRVGYFDAGGVGAYESSAYDKLVRMIVSPRQPAAPKGLLRLADGQVFAGTFQGVQDDGRLVWESPHYGAVMVKLDDVVSFVGPAAAAGAAAPITGRDSDTVVLNNGDKLQGLVDVIGPKTLKLLANEKPLELPWKAVAGVALANPILPKPGVWITTVDGGRAHTTGLILDEGRFAGAVMGKQAFDLAPAAVHAVDFAQTKRLVPLSELPRTVESGGSAFGVSMPPVADERGVRLHAPLRVRFALPPGAERFAAVASIPPRARRLGDMVLTVTGPDGKPKATQRLHAGAPMLELNMKVSVGSLVLTLDPGVNGPVMDRLDLVDPVVLIRLKDR